MLRKCLYSLAFLHCQLAYAPDKTDYLADWTLSKSFAPPLRIRRDSTTLESAPNPHKTPQCLPLIGRSCGLEDQNRLAATSHQKLATDDASHELTPTHIECLKYSTMSWPNLHKLAQFTTRARGTGGGTCVNREIIRKPTKIGWYSTFDNTFKVN